MSTSTMLRQAAADAELRRELQAHPGAFGVSPNALPAPVEQPDQEALDFWTEGVTATEIYACVTSCSFGIFTFVCDGTTK
jgi:hypothetical protein